ncbi:glycosyltransferase family 4 protein [Streptomyces sp. DH8]|uniref:glycosyltransferase family 4 protein n=1 Tax=Streptomyces sp. DH8 TaxID=2857008 RepID=UPI001E3A9E57|nr:glycosyltransferase family 4 protein [Streptomyces sp. DH8]
MRILAILPVYEQVPPAGAMVTTREYVEHLAGAGHAVDVVTTMKRPGEPHTEGRIRVWPLRYWRRAVRASRPQLLVSHHGDRKGARIVAQTPGVPHLLMVHGMAEDQDLGHPDLAWFPSQACRAHYPDHRGRSLVLPPPIDPTRYRTVPGDRVTLSGSTAAKGADVLAAVAGRMPATRFLMVRTPHREDPPLPGNVELIDRTDPKTVYARTRVLLLPSTTESYGRVGAEAMVSGIPVLAAPLPGAREALGTAATYVEREDVDGWVRALRHLSTPAAYRAASAAARARAETLDPTASTRAFEEACASLLGPPSRRGRAQRPPASPRARAAAPLEEADVVAWVHYGVPYRRAGSETMLHTMMRALAEAGTGVLVICSEMPEAPPTWDVDGVPYAQLSADAAEPLIRRMRPKTLVTHHHYASTAITLSKGIGARSVLLLHNDHEQPALALGPDLCVYNTEWVMKSLAVRYPQLDQARALVVHPPVIPEEHRAPRTGSHVTLVNLNRHKGVATWRGAAARLRTVPFLGVTGAHGKQVTRPASRNVRIIPQTSDMRRDVWARTRVLTAPSIYESYGMAAVEALASGIPVIAHPTPGLREALGDAGMFVDRADIPAWAAAIRTLHRDGPARARMVAAAYARSAFLAEQSRRELETWSEAVVGGVR